MSGFFRMLWCVHGCVVCFKSRRASGCSCCMLRMLHNLPSPISYMSKRYDVTSSRRLAKPAPLRAATGALCEHKTGWGLRWVPTATLFLLTVRDPTSERRSDETPNTRPERRAVPMVRPHELRALCFGSQLSRAGRRRHESAAVWNSESAELTPQDISIDGDEQ